MDKEQQIRNLMSVTGMTWEEANRQITSEMNAQNNQNQQQTFGYNTGMFNTQQNPQTFTDYINTLPTQQNSTFPNNYYQNQYTNEDEFVRERATRGVNEQQARQEWQTLPSAPTSAHPNAGSIPGEGNGGEGENKTTFGDIFKNGVPLIYGGGTSADQEAYQFGRFAGMDSGTQGRGVGMVASGLAIGLGTARNMLSGIAFSRQNQQVYEDAQKKMMDRTYSNNPQYKDQNSIGGISGWKTGGRIALKPRSK